MATRKGVASSGPASSRETSRSGIGNRRNVGHGLRGAGHPRLTSPGGCGSVRRLAGPPIPFPSLFPGGPVLEAPQCAELSEGYSGQAGRARWRRPQHSGPGRRGLSHRVSPDPAHRPAEISTVTGGAAEVGDGICTDQPYPTPGGPPAPPTTRSPTRALSVLFCRHHVLIFQHTASYDIAVTSSVRDTRSVCCEV